MMEQWTNNVIDCEGVSTKNILAKQLWRTMRSFDEFLDSKTPNNRVHINSNEKSYFQESAQPMVTEVALFNNDNSTAACFIGSNTPQKDNSNDMEI